MGPIATTSANTHGQPPIVTAPALSRVFGPDLIVVDGGRCDAPPSTVVDLTATPPRCLRAGAVTWEDVESVLGRA